MGDTTQETLARVDLYGTGTAGVLSMIKGYQDSKSRRRAARTKARQARKKGEQEVRTAGIRTGRLYGAQRAAFAANGLDIAGSDTVRQVLADTAEEGVREAVVLRDNSAAEAAGYRNEATSESPFLSALGTGLGAAGTVAGKWYKYSKAGVFGSTSATEDEDDYRPSAY